MSAQHTPGPWSGGKQVSLRAYHCEKLGFSIGFVSSDRNGEPEANARLISAAPDLLAVLRLFAGENKTHTDTERQQAAIAAIKKATGETP